MIKFFKKALFILKMFSIILIFSITFLIVILYGTTPVYNYEERSQFSGDSIYNPYQLCKETQWIKANFHAHSSAWYGLTNGKGQTSKDLYDIYAKLHYDFIGISNYQKIDSYNKDAAQYLPIYEHGYGISKCHQLCIGAKKVNFLEYPFWQSTDDKQYVINTLKEHCKVLSLNHPRFRNGYNAAQLKKITNYDCFEALNDYAFSLNLWDTVLSSGYPAFLIANDDSHDAFDPYDIGRVCTFLNVDTLKSEKIIDALTKGASYGCEVYMGDGESFEKKERITKTIPYLHYCCVSNDTIFVKFSLKARDIVFIGQNGEIVKLAKYVDSTFYKMKAKDTYIRIEMTDDSIHHKLFLNPIFKYKQNPLNHYTATIDNTASLLKKVIYFSSFIVFWIAVFINYKRKKHKKLCSKTYQSRKRYFY